jgi:DNA polymerase III subunit gamma/tau
MENFVVSARKYRPATFDTVVGQNSITTTLKNAIKNNHLAQAFLFTGPRGVGKTTCARILAKTINCQDLSENLEACDQCPPCVSFKQSNSFNVHELDAASNNSVEDIRSLVDQVRIPPQVGKYKVYIIDEVHMLSTAAFNAFLKTLEEPPAYAKFILATTERHKIIPTILSRCQIFDFSRITIEDITKHLQYVAKSEDITADYDALHVIAQKADGALRDALSIFDQMVSFTGTNLTYKQVIENLNVLDYDYYFRTVDLMLQSKGSDILLLINEIIMKGFEGSDFISGFGEHLRNLLVCKEPATIKLVEVSDEVKNRYLEQTSKCPEEFLMKALEVNNRADIQYKTGSNKRLILELSLLQMAGLLKKKILTDDSTEFLPLVEPDDIHNNTDASGQPHQQQASEAENPVDTPAQGLNTEQPEAVKAVTPIGQIRIKKTLSLKVNNLKEKEDQKEDLQQQDSHRPASEFHFSSFLAIWERLAEEIKEESLSLYVAMTKSQPRLLSDNQVEVILDNTIQEEALQEKKQELLGQIRKELNNYSIQLLTLVKETEHQTIAYLPADKFKKLSDKNPSVNSLQKELDLDFLY